ncbi:amino acid ABC transporter permease [Salinispirillum marinum]|uniref:Amino acid ABC transporter permease n=2 Tax=Saccharospirillaceae TaxID=255527 RepID=A0ABV8BD98_9GAMM
MSTATSTVQIFGDLRPQDMLYLGEAALRTLHISAISITAGTLFGIVFGWFMAAGNRFVQFCVNSVLDVFRSVPLLIQLILFDSFIAIAGYPMEAFWSGTIVLSVYTSALVASVARGGIEAVPQSLRRASRSLGMTYWQDMRYVVWPVGIRAVFASWLGIALSVIKDSALVSVLGYVELLRASQILIGRTAETFTILGIAGLFYFALSFPLSKAGEYIEKRWQRS